jgi:hypothetical protein
MYPGRGPRGRIRTGGPDAAAQAQALSSFAGLPGMNMLVAPNLVAPQSQFGGLGVVPVNADGVLTCPDGGPHAAYAHSAPELAAMMLAGAQPPNVYYTAGELVVSLAYRSARTHRMRIAHRSLSQTIWLSPSRRQLRTSPTPTPRAPTTTAPRRPPVSSALLISHASFISSSLRIVRDFRWAEGFRSLTRTRPQQSPERSIWLPLNTRCRSLENREQIRSDIRRRDFRNT